MVAQLKLTDWGADPTHYHVLQGFYDESYEPPKDGDPWQDHELHLSSHLALPDAREQLRDFRMEVEGYVYTQGVDMEVKDASDDRINYEPTEYEEFQLGWMRIEPCERWDCRQLAIEEVEE